MHIITKKLLFCILLFAPIIMLAQKRGNISGTITLSDNSAAENITVGLKNTVYSTISNESGQYEIKNVKPGTYILHISSMGITTVEESITIAEGESVTRDFTVSANRQELDEVVIEANRFKYTRESSKVVSKMPLKNIENPQVYNTITAEILKEQVVTNFDDALKNAPGIDKLWESTGRGSDGAGYYSLRGFAVQPTMVNGLPAITNGSPDPANIESIEVIKGPSGTLFGSSLISYGGLINVNTKRPFSTFGGNINYSGGTYGLNRFAVDVNTPLGAEKKVAVRLNAAQHTENSYQDAGFRKSLFVAPSLTYQATDKLSFFINTEFFDGRSTNPTMLFLDRGTELRVNDINEFGYNHKRPYTGNDLYIDNNTFNLQAQMNYQISPEWTSQTVFSRTSTKSDGYYSYLYEVSQFTTVTEGVVFGRYMSKQNSETYGTDIQQNFIGDFRIGNFRNRVVVGFDYFNRNVVNNSSPYVANGYVYVGRNLPQFTDFITGQGITQAGQYGDDTGILTQAGTDALLADGQIAPLKTKEEIFSAYAQDVFNIFDNLSVMASLRVDRFSNKGNVVTDRDDFLQTALSPKFGIVYQPVQDKVAVFANYMNGFVNVAPGEDRDLAGTVTPRTFKPEQANQFEIGTKLDLFNNRLSATLSYYNIEVSDMVYQLYNGPVAVSNVQDGQQRSKGFEASIIAVPLNGWSILAGYSYNDSKLSMGDPSFVGFRPESSGPRNLLNFWTSYKFSQGALNGFGLGFGGNHASENMIFNRNVGTFTLPEYTIFNASAFYTINDFTLTLKLDNIGNVEYYKGWSTINPQRLRAFAASLSYNF
jgi:iron complex outermembrane recepter protein